MTKWILGGLIAIAALTAAALSRVDWSWTAFWFTPEQQGDRLMAREEFNQQFPVKSTRGGNPEQR